MKKNDSFVFIFHSIVSFIVRSFRQVYKILIDEITINHSENKKGSKRNQSENMIIY